MLLFYYIIENMESYDIKVIIIGIDKLGKSCFRCKAGNNNKEFKQLIKKYKKTIVAEFGFILIQIHNINYRIQLWDIAWHINTIKIFAKDAQAILFFYDSMNRQSFEQIKNLYFSDLKENEAKFYMVRSKYDCKNKPNDNNIDIINDEEVLEFVNENKMNFAHISNIEKYETGIANILKNLLSEHLKIKK